jgi:hypothetical protein
VARGDERRIEGGRVTVAALYVETDGPYFGLPDVDPWDASRDARLYAGPHPVVAHPPCARWSRLAGFVEHVYGHKRGDAGGCFEAALRAVHTYGGVLEHPAYSDAWKAFALPRPISYWGWTLDIAGGASCYVEQGRYGLPVKKATWLYAYGIELPDLRWGYFPDGRGKLATDQDPSRGGMHAWRDAWRPQVTDGRWIDGRGRRVTAADGRQRGQAASRTPVEFRDALLAMARNAKASREVSAA